MIKYMDKILLACLAASAGVALYLVWAKELLYAG